ncbi:MAG: hypothetical protein AAB900_01985, partial [Patescibacteria group bacterium]
MFNKRPTDPRRPAHQHQKPVSSHSAPSKNSATEKSAPQSGATFPISRLAKKKNNFPPRGSRPAHNGPRRPSPSHTNRSESGAEKSSREKIPEIAADVIRIIPLGGVEEIGKNMTAIEIGQDIIIIDAGLAFPGDDAPGVDYIIPDTSYLEEHKSRV